MEQSPWETDSFSVSPEIPCNVFVYYCVKKNLPIVPVLSQINPVHVIPSHLFKIHFHIMLQSMPRAYR